MAISGGHDRCLVGKAVGGERGGVRMGEMEKVVRAVEVQAGAQERSGRRQGCAGRSVFGLVDEKLSLFSQIERDGCRTQQLPF